MPRAVLCSEFVVLLSCLGCGLISPLEPLNESSAVSGTASAGGSGGTSPASGGPGISIGASGGTTSSGASGTTSSPSTGGASGATSGGGNAGTSGSCDPETEFVGVAPVSGLDSGMGEEG